MIKNERFCIVGIYIPTVKVIKICAEFIRMNQTNDKIVYFCIS